MQFASKGEGSMDAIENSGTFGLKHNNHFWRIWWPPLFLAIVKNRKMIFAMDSKKREIEKVGLLPMLKRCKMARDVTLLQFFPVYTVPEGV